MKKNFITLCISFIFLGTSLNAQNMNEVINGIKTGNTTTIVANVTNSLSLTIADKSNTYTAAQAKPVLKDFFAKNSVKSFEINHSGNAANGRFAIGTLTTDQGKYRVNIFMKNTEGKESIRELRFQVIE